MFWRILWLVIMLAILHPDFWFLIWCHPYAIRKDRVIKYILVLTPLLSLKLSDMILPHLIEIFGLNTNNLEFLLNIQIHIFILVNQIWHCDWPCQRFLRHRESKDKHYFVVFIMYLEAAFVLPKHPLVASGLL